MIMPGSWRETCHRLCDTCHDMYRQYDVDRDEDEDEDNDEEENIDSDPIDAECEDDPIMVIQYNIAACEVDSDDPE